MKVLVHKSFVLAALILATLVFSPNAKAQTEPVTATVEVLNALTLTEVDPLDFGIVAAISDAAQTATLTISPVTSVLTPTSTGAPATFAVIDSTNASRAQVTVEDGAAGATLNFTINNVVNPIFGGNAFTLTNWTTTWNAGGATARLVNTPFQYVFSAVYNGGINELNVGASIITQTAVPLYADGIYLGSFDVVASY